MLSHLVHICITNIIITKGLVMAVVTMPLETSKNRMAFQTIDPTTGKPVVPVASISINLII